MDDSFFSYLLAYFSSVPQAGDSLTIWFPLHLFRRLEPHMGADPPLRKKFRFRATLALPGSRPNQAKSCVFRLTRAGNRHGAFQTRAPVPESVSKQVLTGLGFNGRDQPLQGFHTPDR
jgi:hypothetical protein